MLYVFIKNCFLLVALLRGSTSKAIRRLSELLIATNGSMVCSDVVGSSLQTATQLLNDGSFRTGTILDILERCARLLKCLIVE